MRPAAVVPRNAARASRSVHDLITALYSDQVSWRAVCPRVGRSARDVTAATWGRLTHLYRAMEASARRKKDRDITECTDFRVVIRCAS